MSFCSILDDIKHEYTTYESETRRASAESRCASPDAARMTAQVPSTPQNDPMMIKESQVANPEERPPSTASMGSIPHSLLQLADMNLKSALVAYLTADTLSKDIAREHGFTAGVLSYWARKFGLPLRRRGRRPLLQPTSVGQRILELVRAHGISETARLARTSKQRVHQIVSRWEPELKGHRKAPKSLERPQRERRPPRTVVVSFRISTEEWLRLSASEVTSAGLGLSAYEKAREIVLKFIVSSGGGGQDPIQGYLGSSMGPTNTAAEKRIKP